MSVNGVIMEHLFKTIAEKYDSRLQDYKPICTGTVSDDLADLIATTAAKYIDMPYPSNLATDYMRLVRCGNRSEYEEKYFAKRYKLTSLVAAYYCKVYTGESVDCDGQRLLDEIINGIWSICEETSWCLPAHNTYVRDTPQIILPDSEKPVMDLFACETGATLSMIYYLIKDDLDKISPLICERILNEVKDRIIYPYVNSHFWWMGNGDEPMCNWTVWCIQNSLLCAFLLPINDSDRRIIFDKACYGVDCFLKDYGEDGCCDEGAQYYRHAGLCLFGCLDILNTITNGHFRSLFDNAKIKNIAEFIVNVHVGGKFYVNYSDCSPLAGNCGVREYLFGTLCKLPALVELAAHDFCDSLANGSLFEDESVRLNLYYRMQTIYHADKILSYIPCRDARECRDARKCNGLDTLASCTAPTDKKNIYYESVGVCVMRSNSAATPENERLTLAIKAGDNNDSHNHNDTGSIILYKGLDPIFVDIGPETYSQKTFSPKRYEIWTMQSGYHNLPTIDGLDELAGSEYRATDVIVHIDSNASEDTPRLSEKYVSMNIATAYPMSQAGSALNGLSYIRRVTVDSLNNTVILSDSCSCNPLNVKNGIILNFITYHKPEIEESSNLLKIKIGSATATLSGAAEPIIETLPITDARLQKSWERDLYRIRLRMIKSDFRMEIK